MDTIVVGFDGTSQAREALARAADMADALSAKLVVATVSVPVADAGYPLAAPPIGPVVPPPPAVTDEVEEASGEHLEEARELLTPRGVDADFVLRHGPAADALVQLADERDADLLVVGTRELGFLGRLLTGSVSQEVAREARCDVLVVRGPHGAAAA